MSLSKADNDARVETPKEKAVVDACKPAMPIRAIDNMTIEINTSIRDTPLCLSAIFFCNDFMMGRS